MKKILWLCLHCFVRWLLLEISQVPCYSRICAWVSIHTLSTICSAHYQQHVFLKLARRRGSCANAMEFHIRNAVYLRHWVRSKDITGR